MATIPVTPDLETISMDELRKLAEAEALAQSTPVLKPATIVPEKETPIDPEVKTLFAERTIDLGDGAGVQVFKGKGASREAALEDLSNLLADAQKHATRKIRELNAAAKVKPVEKTYTADEESLYSAELMSTPTEAVSKILKSKGLDIEETKQLLALVKEEQEAKKRQRAGNAFVASHPDFADTARNGNLINQWCKLHNDFSSESFEKAYQDLNESGLLDVKGEEAGVGQEEDKPVTGIPPKVEVTPSQRTKKASGLSTQRRTAVPVASEPSEEDMYALPLEELRKRANQQLTGH